MTDTDTDTDNLRPNEEEELREFAWDIADGCLEHVFSRFPADAVVRAQVYRHVASQLLDIADDLMRVENHG